MASDDGTILRDGENELDESPAGSSNVTMPIGTAMPSASGRASEPLGEGDNPLGDAVTDESPAVPNAGSVVMGGGAGGDGDRQEPDGTDGADGGGV